MNEKKALQQLEKLIGRPIVKSLNINETGYSLNNDGKVFSLRIFDSPSLEGNITHQICYFLEFLPSLSQLFLQNMSVSNVIPFENLHSLNYLDLSRNKIFEVEALAKLPNLECLFLHQNTIPDISPLASIVSLKELGLFNNRVSDIRQLETLVNLEQLWLNNNHIERIDALKNLVSLNKLWLGKNKIINISALKKLEKLEKLWLSDNMIENIQPLSQLNLLNELYLSNNKISDISPIRGLKNLQNIDLSGNPINDPPPEIIKQGVKTIFSWFTARKKQLNEIKILLVGDPTAGKTSLCKRLKDDSFSERQNQTNGIVIETFRFGQMRTFAKHAGLKNITAHIWDFGGQEILTNTHQFFLTNRSLYILMLDARSDIDAELQIRRWMERIIPNGGNSPVIVVINKIELNRGFGVDVALLQKEYPQIKSFVNISCAQRENLDTVKKLLEEWIPKTVFFKTQVDERWLNLKSELEEIAQLKPRLTREEFIKVCIRSGLSSIFEQDQCVRFLNDLGVLLHFDELVLNEYYVLDPYWVTTGVYRIITSDIAGIQRGEIDIDDLPRILNDKRPHEEEKKHLPQHINYTFSECLFFANMMEYFQLCYSIPSSNKILIPDLLDKNTPLHAIKQFEDAIEKIQFVYTYNFLPSYLIPRLIFIMRNEIKLMWRSGLILQYYDKMTEACIVAYPSKNRIEIIITGEAIHSREYLAIIRSHIDSFNKKHRLEPIMQVPLPGLKGCMVDFFMLRALRDRGEQQYMQYVNGSFHIFSITELINGLHNTEENEVLAKKLTYRKLKTNNAIVTEQSGDKGHNIFVSYSKNDLIIVKELVLAFGNLSRQGKVKMWSDGLINPGSDWDHEIKNQLDNADIVLCMISPGFMANTYINEIELPRAIARLGKEHVIPIFTTSTDIEGSEIATMQGLLTQKQYPNPIEQKYVQDGTYWLRNISPDDRDPYYTAIVKELRKKYQW